MRKVSLSRTRVLYTVAILCLKLVGSSNTNYEAATSIYDFTAEDIYGKDISLEKYRKTAAESHRSFVEAYDQHALSGLKNSKGHVCIIVNVASECGLTDTNYDQLNYLYQKYGQSEGLKILAFPTNEFGGQEPGSNEDILNFAKFRGVKYDLFSKIEVNGENAHPLWKYLKHKQGGYLGDSIKWNFSKFIIDRKGQVVERFAPTTSPNDMVEYLEKYFTENSSSRESNREL